MGSFNLADAATGLSIARGERVVAVVLDRRQGGYPDAGTHAANGGVGATHLFEPVSLPIRGTYDDYGNIKPSPGQVSVDLVLDLAGRPDWKSFQEDAMDSEDGIRLGKAARSPQGDHPGDPDGRRRVLGLAVYRASTWDVLVKSSRMKGRDDDVRAVIDAMERVRSMAKADRMQGALNAAVLGLEATGLNLPDGGRQELPRLARALLIREGGNVLGDVARRWLTGSPHCPLGYRSLSREPSPDLPAILGALWDLQAAERGLDLLGKPYLASQKVGGFDNGPFSGDLAIATLRDAGDRLHRAAEDDDERAAERLEAMLGAVDALRERLADKLAQATQAAAPRR